MGLLKSIFGKKDDTKKEQEVAPSEKRSDSVPKSRIQELIMLSLAEKYKVGESKYPDYIRSEYGIGFPGEAFESLEKKGHIRQSTAKEALPNLKVTELKTVASNYGLKVPGKKEDLCNKIAENVSEEDLAQHITERYWKVTEQGEELLKENPYIGYYLDKHEYNLRDIGLDVFKFSKLYEKPQKVLVRDRLWGEFNRLSTEFYAKGMSKGDFRDYCALLHIMALFLKEESKYKDALAQYMRFLYYRANFMAALAALRHYSFTGSVDDDAIMLTSGVEILPFTAQEILSISNGCGFDSSQLKSFMLEAFSKEKDEGIFTTKELTELTMLGLNGDREGQKEICVKAMKVAMRKIPKKRK